MLQKTVNYLIALSETEWNYKASFVADIVVGLVILGLGLYSGGKWYYFLLCIPTGYVIWSLQEYFFHRFVFHHRHRNLPLTDGHHRHHQNQKFLTAMPWFSSWLLAPAYLGLISLILPFNYAAVMAAFIDFSYVAYGLLHHFQHNTHFKNTWLKELRTHHMIHHQFDTVNFGVSTRFWDMVFSTRYKPKKARS